MSWMAWTLPTAIFFSFIILSVIGMTLWELKSPTVLRKGLLWFATTRGDRFFMCLLGSAIIHILWIAWSDVDLVVASVLCLLCAVVVMRYA
jgi:predicted small integral membrane protein